MTTKEERFELRSSCRTLADSATRMTWELDEKDAEIERLRKEVEKLQINEPEWAKFLREKLGCTSVEYFVTRWRDMEIEIERLRAEINRIPEEKLIDDMEREAMNAIQKENYELREVLTQSLVGGNEDEITKQNLELRAEVERMQEEINRSRSIFERFCKDEMAWRVAARVEIKRLRAELDKHRWIPVTERLPEMGDFVMVWFDVDDGNGARGVMTYRGDDDRWGDDYANAHVTHWRPLPEPPEVEG